MRSIPAERSPAPAPERNEEGAAYGLARHVAASDPAALPAQAVRAAKRCIRDTIGVMLLGSTKDFGREVGRFFAGFGGAPQASLIGGARKMAAPEAAYANAVSAKVPELEDGHRTLGMFHLGPSVIPACLAAAEWRGLSGAELINAVVVGYDVGIRLGAAMDVCARLPLSVNPSIACGSLAATAAVARLYRLDAERVIAAWTVAAGQMPLAMVRHVTAVSTVNVGAAARVGVLAPLMARDLSLMGSGLSLEGEDGFCARVAGTCRAAELVRGLGVTHPIETVYFKPYPSCRYTHAAVTAVLDLKASRALDAKDVREVSVSVGVEAWRLRSQPSVGATAPLHERQTAAKFDVRYNVAVALAYGRLDVEHFEEAVMTSPEIRALMDRITVRHDPSFDCMPAKMPAAVRVTTAGDGVLSRQVDYPRGEPEDPMDEAELREKFRRLAGAVLSSRQIDEVEGCLGELEDLADVGQLVDMLRP